MTYSTTGTYSFILCSQSPSLSLSVFMCEHEHVVVIDCCTIISIYFEVERKGEERESLIFIIDYRNT